MSLHELTEVRYHRGYDEHVASCACGWTGSYLSSAAGARREWETHRDEAAAGPMWCKYCGPEFPLRIERRLEARPIGSFSLAGAQMKLSAREWPYAVCDGCGRESRGKWVPSNEEEVSES